MDCTQLTDGELVARFARGGDGEAFEELVRRHGAMVLRVCCRVTSNRQDAEDAAQRVFAILFAKSADLESCRSLAGWLYSAAWRVGRRTYRSEATRRRHEAQAGRPEMVAANGDAAIADEEVLHEVYRAIEMLPMEYCEALVLHHLNGLSVREVAELMACSQGTTAARLSRGRAMVRERLSRRGVVLSAAALETALVVDLARAEQTDRATVIQQPSGELIVAMADTQPAFLSTASAAGSASGSSALATAGVVATLHGARKLLVAAYITGSAMGIASVPAYYLFWGQPETKTHRVSGSASKQASTASYGMSSYRSSSSSGGPSVPEPAGLSVLALGALALRRHRRKL